jgi:hypothetical protein
VFATFGIVTNYSPPTTNILYSMSEQITQYKGPQNIKILINRCTNYFTSRKSLVQAEDTTPGPPDGGCKEKSAPPIKSTTQKFTNQSTQESPSASGQATPFLRDQDAPLQKSTFKDKVTAPARIPPVDETTTPNRKFLPLSLAPKMTPKNSPDVPRPETAKLKKLRLPAWVKEREPREELNKLLQDQNLEEGAPTPYGRGDGMTENVQTQMPAYLKQEEKIIKFRKNQKLIGAILSKTSPIQDFTSRAATVSCKRPAPVQGGDISDPLSLKKSFVGQTTGSNLNISEATSSKMPLEVEMDSSISGKGNNRRAGPVRQISVKEMIKQLEENPEKFKTDKKPQTPRKPKTGKTGT